MESSNLNNEEKTVNHTENNEAEVRSQKENHQESNHSKEPNKKNQMNIGKVLEFVRKHIRYFAAGALFVALVLVLVKCAEPKENTESELQNPTEIMEETEEAYQVDAYEDVNNLVAQYYAAYAAGDVDALASLATPVSTNEQSYITLFSQYVEEYRNITCYTKSGLDASSYLVSVAMEIKFAGVDTTAPGLDFFYVRTNEDGSLYIDNLYSQFNLANQENALDTSVQRLITEFENEADVMLLQQEIQGKYDAAIASDENLSKMISETIPAAITEWVTTIVEQNTEAVEDNPTEIAESETSEAEEQESEQQEEESESEEPESEQKPEESEEPKEENNTVSETLTATERVNVRASADTSAEKLGTVEKGEKVTRIGTDGDWSIIEYKDAKGYIKTEYLSTGAVESEPAADPIAEGTVIRLENTVNIRSAMSETSDRVGTAYSGEKVTVVMSYAEGWTKVNWNNKTGYIKTSLLQ